MRIVFASPNKGARFRDARVRIANWITNYLGVDSKLKLEFVMGEWESPIRVYFGDLMNFRCSFIKWRCFVCIKRRCFINFRRIPRKNSGMPRPHYFSRKIHGSGRKGILHTSNKFMTLYATLKGCGKNRKMAKVRDI